MESKIRQAALELRDKYNCVAYKMETEAEGLSFIDISDRINLLGGVLPINIKIGGPAARGDIRRCLSLGVDGLTAPMVESAYGLKDFIESLENIATPVQFKSLQKSINIETKTAYANLDEILASPHIKNLNQISIGRSDMAGSLEEQVDSERMFEIVSDIAKRSRAAGLKIGVGGAVMPGNVQQVIARVKPDKVNTRNIVFAIKDSVDYGVAVEKALELEIYILEWKRNTHLDYAKQLEKRINTLKSRLGE